MNDIEIYDRQRLLALEKELAGHHQAIQLILRDVGQAGPHEASDGLRAALWQLGVAIVNVAAAQQAEEASLSSRAYP